jgi:enoyl-CoA hydratase
MLTTYALSDGIATITMDDGKVNALSSAMLAELMERLDQAEADGAVVILTGRATTFSAGFDLRAAPEDWPPMLAAGARLAERLLSFPRPDVAASNGSAIAMGAFTLLSCDERIGVSGDVKIGLNEVQIGMTLPFFGIAIARHRLTTTAFDRCSVTGVVMDAEAARDAGFLDRVVAPENLEAAALEAAQRLLAANADAHRNTKLRVREGVLAGIRDGIELIETRELPEW